MAHSEPPKIYVISLGCAKNLVDTEVMCGGLAVAGFVLTNIEAAADVMLINTCGFIADARTEADAVIRNALRWKRGRRRRKVVVSGCIPQRNLGEARAAYPGVDLFLGLDDVPVAADRISALLAGKSEAGREKGFERSTYVYDHTTPRLQLTPQNFAYVNIAEGCDHHCRFCAIPRIRGHFRSRAPESIVDECGMLLQQGVRELNLIAQDTTRYGADSGTAGLAELLHRLDALPGEFWLRVLYTHPRHFSEEIMAAFGECAHLVPYVDMPLQHISDKILRGMGRGMNGASTRALMERIRQEIADVAVRTTFLVGYPGETDADFAELLEFVRAYRFDRLGVFVFSPEADTPSAAMTEGLVPPELAVERQRQLLEAQQHISLERNRDMLGRTVTVLAEGLEGEGQFVGRTMADAPEVDNLVHFTSSRDAVETGLVPVVITEADAYDLFGTVSEPGG